MDAPAAHVEGVTHRSVEANGIRFHVAECGGGDRLALCLHGFPDLWFSWREQMGLLAKLGYRVWAPDLRGYGDTERPEGVASYAIETLMDDVASLIDAADARSTLLIGHDWGGVIAWYFATRKLRALEKLVVMNCPHPEAMRAAMRGGWAQRRRSLYAYFFQLPRLPEWLLGRRHAEAIGRIFERAVSHPERFPPEVRAVYRAAASQRGALTAMLNYYRALLRGGGARRQTEQGMPPIETPTLLVWGENDVALGVETTRDTGRWVPDLTLRYLSGGSHWVNQDVPDEVNAILEAWLGGVAVPGAPS